MPSHRLDNGNTPMDQRVTQILHLAHSSFDVFINDAWHAICMRLEERL